MFELFRHLIRLPLAFSSAIFELAGQTLHEVQRFTADPVAEVAREPRPPAGVTPPSATRTGGPVLPQPTTQPPPSREDTIMSDRNLNDDMVKLVRYSIVSIQRDKEEVLVKEQEKIFDDKLTDDAFATWVISDYASETNMDSNDRKYLRVSWSVKDRWPRQDREYEKRKLEELEGIKEAIDRL